MNLKINIVLSLLVFVLCGATQAHAFPKPSRAIGAEQFIQLQPSGNLTAGNFRSIVALNNCSGSLVKFTHSLDTDHAMVLTNGHCLTGPFIKPNEVRVNLPVTRHFALLNDNGSKLTTLRAERILISTMTKTDITLYRLTETYAEISQKYGVQGLILSPQHPVLGTSIAIISGYWKKIYSCNIDKFIHILREADWEMHDSIRYSSPGCEIIGGTSGSPIINLATNEVIGVNNTINESGKRCTEDNPCEVDEKGNVTVNLNAAYGQETYWLYSCLDQQRNIDLNVPGCVLKP